MKTLYLQLFLLVPILAFSQDLELRKKIDSTVKRIQACPNGISAFTRLETINGHKTEINYQYKTCKGFGACYERKFSNKDSSVSQIFYEWDYQLVFSTERIVNYYARDSITWGGTYYFSGGRLRDHETLGHGKSEIDTWNPETEVLGNYHKTRNTIRSFYTK